MRSTGRLWICLLMLMAALSPGWIATAGAQDATPEADDSRSAAGASAAEVGTSVTYVDAEGVERGAVTVLEVVDPFTDYDEAYPPADGTRFVLLNVSFEATGDGTFDADPYDILVRDADGYLWSWATVYRPSEPAIPDAQGQTLASGNRISGAITFIVPEDTPLAQIFYQPESGLLILLADLQEDAAPGVGDEVTYTDAEGTEHGIVSVMEVIDPFTDFDEGYEPEEGARYVVIHISFEATGEGPFAADPGDLLIRDGDGYLWSWASVNRGAEPSMPEAQSQNMSPGNKISGAVGFIVPEDTPLAQIYYQPESGHLILLADLGEDG